MNKILQRKIISASVSGTLFAIILGLISPDPFNEQSLGSFLNYLYSAVGMTTIYMLYSFPVILIYGVLSSIISDKIGEFLSGKLHQKKVELIVSGALHIVFGLILFWASLGVAILFFITDRFMKSRNNRYDWLQAIKSLTIPVFTWLIFVVIIRLGG